MNPNLTEIIFIIDRSGSMSHLTQDTIGGYNSFLEEQKKNDGDANVTTILFNESVHVVHDRVPIQHVPALTKSEYIASGMTALYDAVGHAIDTVGQKLSQTPEKDRPSNVIVVITTDGEENSSREYSGSRIKEMIEHQQSKYNWTFLFIGAGIDAYRSSSSIGIKSANTASYAASVDGLDNIYTSASKAVCSIRGCGTLDALWKEDGEISSADISNLQPVDVAGIAQAVSAVMCADVSLS